MEETLDFSRLKILTIDDSNMTRRIIRQILTGFGVNGENILEAKDGQTGLDIVERNQNLDLILCDLNMKPINGFEFVESLRKRENEKWRTIQMNEKLRNIPVLILTLHGEKSFVAKASRLNIDGYLLKPISPQALRQRVIEAVEMPPYF